MLPADPANSRNSAIFLNLLLVHDPYYQFMSAEGRLSVWLNSNFPAEQVMKQVMKLTVDSGIFGKSAKNCLNILSIG